MCNVSAAAVNIDTFLEIVEAKTIMAVGIFVKLGVFAAELFSRRVQMKSSKLGEKSWHPFLQND